MKLNSTWIDTGSKNCYGVGVYYIMIGVRRGSIKDILGIGKKGETLGVKMDWGRRRSRIDMDRR